MKSVLFSLILLAILVYAEVGRALPDGAPPAACPDIFPLGHNGTIPNEASDPLDSPFALDLSAFRRENSTYHYYPGWAYASELGVMRLKCIDTSLYDRVLLHLLSQLSPVSCH